MEQEDIQRDEWNELAPRSIRVNADNSDKKAVAAFWIVFASLLVVVFITSNFTPSTFVYKNNRSELAGTHHRDCSNPVSFENGILVCQDFNVRNPKLGLIMRSLSPLNQFAQINLVILPNNYNRTSIQIKQTLQIELMSLNRKKIVTADNKTMIGFEKGEDVKVITGLEFDTQTFPLKEVVSDENRLELGYEISLGYYRQFKTQDALLVVTFKDINWDLYINNEFILTAILMNENYTKFIMIMRGVFLGIMTITTAIYLSRLKYKNRRPALPEQEAVTILAVAVILFNDPYYFIGVFKPNVYSIFVQTFFLAVFFIVLFWSWIYMLEKINVESRGGVMKMTGFKKWIYSLAGIDYFCIIFAFNYQIGYYAWTDSPIVPVHRIFSVILIITSVFFGLLFLYIFYLYIRLLQVWNDIIWRHKLFITFNLFFVGLLLSFISLGWFSLYDESSQKFEILYASMNIYVLYLQFMYSHPLKQEQEILHEEFQEVKSISTVINQNQMEVIDLDGEYNRDAGKLQQISY